MPVHDWARVDAGIFHDFHHEWISSIKSALNNGILPDGYYSLAEQHAAGFGPDVLTLQGPSEPQTVSPQSTATLPKPRTKPIAEAAQQSYRRRQKVVTVRHVSGDDIVAMVELVPTGNKNSWAAMRSLVHKAAQLIDQRIHLLIVDLYPPGPRDPNGVHAAIWDEVEADTFRLPENKPLTAASYECDLTTKAYVENFAVGEVLPDMPLFLAPGGCVDVPLEITYERAFAAVPARWRRVLKQ